MKKTLILLIVLHSALAAYKYNLSVFTMFKDEAPYLKEWIEYHKILGVNHFILYNNDSTDNYLEVLEPYIDCGDVELLDWPSSQETLKNWVYLVQIPGCMDAINRSINVSKWLAIIDVDEFIHPLIHTNIPLFLRRYEKYPGVILNWQCFGTSQLVDIPPGKLLIESLIWKAEPYSKHNIAVKSIVRPEKVDVSRNFWAPHTFYYKNNEQAVYPNFHPSPTRLDLSLFGICPKIAVINHYVHRTEGYIQMKEQKKLRMEPYLDMETFVEYRRACNCVMDVRMNKIIPKLRKRIFNE